MTATRVPVILAERSYDIHISSGDWALAQRMLRRILHEERLFVVTNTRLRRLYGDVVQKQLGRELSLEWIVIPDGEAYKTLATVEKILTQLSQRGASRQSLLLALGGGVVGDITGFAAAIYMRGIDFVQMPTTLLAQVDSSVGGKTGVDLKTGKNLAGAFYQPRAVLIHTDFLKTLPQREFLCGLAEVIKYGMIADEPFFKFLEKQRDKILAGDARALRTIIQRSVAIKADVVARDEKEASLRAILNFGHTLGHAVEVLTGFTRVRHGEAVAMGMVFAARLAHKRQLCEAAVPERLQALLKAYGLPVSWPALPAARYAQAMLKDKKAAGRNIKFILPRKIGKVDIVSLKPEDVRSCL